MTSTSKYAQYSFGDPEWDKICATIFANRPSDAPINVEHFRRQMSVNVVEDLKKSLPWIETGLSITDHKVPVDGAEITVRSYIPDVDSADTFPLMIWIHGGAWIAGDLGLDDSDLRILCTSLKISIASVDYRLAPEYKFPTPIDDSLVGFKWAIANAGLLRADLGKGVIVAGSSAGGNLAAQVALHAREDPLYSKTISGQLLQMPFLALPAGYPDKYKDDLRSDEDLADMGLLVKSFQTRTREMAGLDPTSPRLSPLLVPSLTGLPRAYIQICGRDPLRDEGILYAKLLQDAGVEVRSEIYKGCPHAFTHVNPNTEAARKWRRDAEEGIRWLLGL
ncbi:hypothetical protein SISNIDRAFT_459689 [Sistotremastrum niveocremeum HHB9708]|uniref:Alpha/beta hydrolase fold-3 domain-containing protein n=1 Tax=Sistotremastrum niveocremeum HHB9708 TaxID=1314777 RepID=A0A164P883_9AGAM|nr:hypothetical protein SISNIDRAFT_459689 [Sistotremastrum niveocremeum HHB9708]